MRISDWRSDVCSSDLGEDARQQVEGDQPFRIAALAINGEGDADAPEDRLRLIHPTIESGNARPLHPVLHFRVTGAYRTVRLKHFVEGQSVDPPSAGIRLVVHCNIIAPGRTECKRKISV